MVEEFAWPMESRFGSADVDVYQVRLLHSFVEASEPCGDSEEVRINDPPSVDVGVEKDGFAKGDIQQNC